MGNLGIKEDAIRGHRADGRKNDERGRLWEEGRLFAGVLRGLCDDDLGDDERAHNRPRGVASAPCDPPRRPLSNDGLRARNGCETRQLGAEESPRREFTSWVELRRDA
ncbi:hypothetical protein KC19_3G141200 [Ceratodon purpureus]|uniref:Uncharacterized protein n=1 Tax=Ceratodon purpureus TaxID=3225 RepID=A0A8T0ILP3_CERPU|nr:hypothetical protein KC19_3G141200 [Ceratodon purpureus]